MSAPIDKHRGEYGGTNFWWDSPFPWRAAYPPNPDWSLPAFNPRSTAAAGAGSGIGCPRLSGDDLEELLSGELSDEEVAELDAELGFSLKKILRKAGKIVKTVAPIVKAVGVAVAFVVPPAGIAITAAAAGADKLVSAAQRGGAAAKKAKHIFKATKLLASQGDPGAQQGLQLLARVHEQRKKDKVPPGTSHPKLAGVTVPKESLLKAVKVQPTGERGFFVTLDGRIQRRGI